MENLMPLLVIMFQRGKYWIGWKMLHVKFRDDSCFLDYISLLGCSLWDFFFEAGIII